MAENKGTTDTAAGRELVITRVFNAPRKLVFKAFTEAERMAQWWGPKGSSIHVAKLDFRPGGMFHYSLESPDGNVMWARFIYREIMEPEKIVFVSSFSDEQGNITRAPFFDNWPLEILNKLTLTENGGKTTLTLKGGPINATEDERSRFESLFSSMQQGFSGTFDQLEEFLSKES